MPAFLRSAAARLEPHRLRDGGADLPQCLFHDYLCGPTAVASGLAFRVSLMCGACFCCLAIGGSTGHSLPGIEPEECAAALPGQEEFTGSWLFAVSQVVFWRACCGAVEVNFHSCALHPMMLSYIRY